MFDLASLEKRLSDLERKSQDPALWDDPERAEKILRERAHVEAQVQNYRELETAVADLPVY
ncbi:MAG: PCRF domain-containing protein, partial [Deltaproteobacteria bacterium]